MARDLIVSFLSSVPAEVMALFKEKPLTLCCPVQQTAIQGYPGGRTGYQKWLAEHADGSSNVVPGLARAAGLASGESIGKVAALGFSNGCIGVWEMLRAPDAFKLDAALFIDGIHGMYSWDGKIVPGLYKPVANFAAHCAQQNPEQSPNAPVCVITHSSIGPIMRQEGSRIVPQSPSTTETADLIWQLVNGVAPPSYLSPDCGYGCLPVLHLERMAQQYAGPDERCVERYDERCKQQYGEQYKQRCKKERRCFQWLGLQDGFYDRRGANNFYVLGWGNVEGGEAHTKDPGGTADHIFQGQVVLPAVVEEFLVRRWNRQCYFAATSGLGQVPMSACELGHGVDYSLSDAGPHDYFPDLENAPAPQPCPTPPPGGVLVGAPGDPCAIVGAQPPAGAEPSAAQERTVLSASSLVWGGLGFAGGFWLLSRAWR